jgi:hypothetical protein
MTDDQPKRGRPSDYSFQVAISICDRLADGESLAGLLRLLASDRHVAGLAASERGPPSSVT